MYLLIFLGFAPLFRYRTFVQAVGGHDGLQRAAMRQQHYHDPDPFSRSVQPLPPSVCGRSKGLAALPTVEVPFFARMNTNVA